MRARSWYSLLRVVGILGGSLTLTALSLLACGPGPVVVTDADQALLVPPKATATATASASATATTSAKAPPLLVPDQPVVELPPFSCPPDKQLTVLGQTFCIVLELHDWHRAEAHCQEIGAHLATMRNTTLPIALRDAIMSPTGVDRFWIGLAEPSEGRWIWSNGTPLKFAAFRPAEPNNSGGNEDCAEWLVEDGRWNDVDCFQPRHFLCEAPAVAPGSRAKALTCNGKRFTVEKTDYCLEAPARWDVAQRACLQRGGELARLDTEAENTALFKAFGPKLPITTLWIGLSDEANEGQFRWITGDPFDTPMWRVQEPNDFQPGEDCVEWAAADGRWNDLSCATPRPSLCQKPQLAVGK